MPRKSKEEIIIEEKRVDNSVFLIGILGGILISILVESLYIFIVDLHIAIIVVMIVISIIGLIYLWGWYRIVNSINNYSGYIFTFQKIHKDKRIEDIFESFYKTLKEKLEKNNYSFIYIKDNFIKKLLRITFYNSRIVVKTRFSNIVYIDFKDDMKKNNKYFFKITIINSKHGDLVKNKILETINYEEKKQKNIKNGKMIKKCDLYYSLKNPFHFIQRK